MLAMYEHMGYRRYCPGYDDADYGFKYPILMLLGDRAWFETVGSPFARFVPDGVDDGRRGPGTWFDANYPDHIDPPTARFLGDEAFADLLTDRASGWDPAPGLGSLRRLRPRRRARPAPSVHHRSGGRRRPCGAPGRGRRHGVRAPHRHGRRGGREPTGGRTIGVLGPGDLFGEGAYLADDGRRGTASVIAATPTELLVLPGDAIARATARDAGGARAFVDTLARTWADRRPAT